MLGDTITVTLGGSGGTARVCNKINQDNFGAVYLNRISTDEIEVRVRHLKETPKNGQLPIERHTFNVNQTVFATDTTPEFTRSAFLTLRCSKNDDTAKAVDLGEALSYLADGTLLAKLFGWES